MNTVNLVEEIGLMLQTQLLIHRVPILRCQLGTANSHRGEKTNVLRFLNSVVTETSHKCNKRYLGNIEQLLVEDAARKAKIA